LAFVPDGKRIAFAGKLPDRPWRIFVVPLSGGEPEALTPDDQNAADPSWSPDGQSLMFGVAPGNVEAASPPRSISILNLNSKQFTLLPHSEGLFSPHWSPNGRYVVAKPQSQPKLLLFDFATQECPVKLSPSSQFHKLHSNSAEL
jgi:Tol biopolymer transport system component